MLQNLVYSKIYIEKQRAKNSQDISEGEEKGVTSFQYIKASYKADVMKTVCFWCRNIHFDQWNRKNRPKIDLLI